MRVEYKDVQAELKALDDKGEGILRFIRFHQEDKDSDITLPGFISQQEAILISAHNWKSDYPPIGRGESFEADNSTQFRFRLNLDDERARSWHSWLTLDRKFSRPLQQVSYGFSLHPEGMEYAQKDGRRIRILKPRPDGPGATLHEVSFVTVGSGNDTAVLDLKSAQPSPAVRRSWPGGLTPMEKGMKEHVSEAVSSMWSAQRRLHQYYHEIAGSPVVAKAHPLFETVLEHLDAAAKSMSDVLLVLPESPVLSPLPPVVAPKASEPPAVIAPGEAEGVTTDPPPEPLLDGEKTGGVPIREDVQHLKESLDRVTERLEAIQRLRGTASERYPNGRPMPTDLLEQVDAFVPRLSRLKLVRADEEQRHAAQEELEAIAERMKKYGITV